MNLLPPPGNGLLEIGLAGRALLDAGLDLLDERARLLFARFGLQLFGKLEDARHRLP